MERRQKGDENLKEREEENAVHRKKAETKSNGERKEKEEEEEPPSPTRYERTVKKESGRLFSYDTRKGSKVSSQ